MLLKFKHEKKRKPFRFSLIKLKVSPNTVTEMNIEETILPRREYIRIGCAQKTHNGIYTE